MRHLAEKALWGVGDARLGEWIATRPMAVHLRRRLSAAEAADVGPVRDLRGTIEGWARYDAIAHTLPAMVRRLALDELNEKP